MIFSRFDTCEGYEPGSELVQPNTRVYLQRKRKFKVEQLRTEEEIVDYIMDSYKYEIAKDRCTFVRCFRKHSFPQSFINNLEMHMLLKFSDANEVSRYVQNCILEVGQQFWRDFVLYASDYIYGESDFKEISIFRVAFNTKPDNEVMELFQSVIQANPKNEAKLYTTLVIMQPDNAHKVVNKTFPAILRHDQLPACFEAFMFCATKDLSQINLKRDDASMIMRKYAIERFEKLLEKPNERDEIPKPRIDRSVVGFLKATKFPGDCIFGKINPPNTPQPISSFIESPTTYELKHNSDLFLTYFFAYIRMGLFYLETGECCITWNKYFEDRWPFENRDDLFEGGRLYRMHHWEAQYTKIVKEEDRGVPFTHPYHTNFVMVSKFYDFIKFSDKSGHLKRFGYEDFIQYFSIALTYCEQNDKMEKVYFHNKFKMEKPHAILCLLLNGILAHAKNGKVGQVADDWVRLMSHCVKWKLVEPLKLSYFRFEVPDFIGKEGAAAVATRILRNCLFLEAKRLGVEGWKKYGLLVLYICDILDDSFVNYNIIRFMLDAISPDDIADVLGENWWQYIQTAATFNEIHQRFSESCPRIFENMDLKTVLIEKRGKLQSIDYKPLLEIYKKFMEYDRVFKCITTESQDYYDEFLIKNFDHFFIVEEVKEEEKVIERDYEYIPKGSEEAQNPGYTNPYSQNTYKPTCAPGEMPNEYDPSLFEEDDDILDEENIDDLDDFEYLDALKANSKTNN